MVNKPMSYIPNANSPEESPPRPSSFHLDLAIGDASFTFLVFFLLTDFMKRRLYVQDIEIQTK